MHMNIVALVVTYNRKELLEECINALLKQTDNLNSIVIVDNNSNDGTSELVNKYADRYKEIIYIKLKENLGGAGGFSQGIKYINENLNFDWLWLMDDDTIPYPDSLKNLLHDVQFLNKKEEKVSFLASSVFGPDNEPMNVPTVSKKIHPNGYCDWYRYLKEGIVEIQEATFVSLLINKEALEQVGYPIADYFIWGDDTEYTNRLTSSFGPAFFSGKSEVLHKRFNAMALSIKTEKNKNRIEMYKYLYRNNLWNMKKYEGKSAYFKRIIIYVKDILNIMISSDCSYKMKKIKIILTGIVLSVKNN